MGRFTGVWIASDFDNTMADTQAALKEGGKRPELSERNRAALEYFMAEGGIFSVSTGRSIPSFEVVRSQIPMNGPTILFNGAATYDYKNEKYICTAFLPEEVRGHIRQVLHQFPLAACEIYHEDKTIHVLQPNRWTQEHMHLTHSKAIPVEQVEQVPAPLSKILFETDPDLLNQVKDYVIHQPWGADYEVVHSSDYLLEVTAKGATKGGMVQRLGDLMGIVPQHRYCIGDYSNDVDMLRHSAIPFAPANAVEEIRHLPGICLLPPCWENTMEAMVEVLKERYPEKNF